MVKGSFLILGFLVLGEAVSLLLNGWLPGNVLGMIFLFAALQLNWVKPGSIEQVALFLTNNMALFFIPAGVGLMGSYHLLGAHWFFITLAAVVSTMAVIAIVGYIQQKYGKHG